MTFLSVLNITHQWRSIDFLVVSRFCIFYVNKIFFGIHKKSLSWCWYFPCSSYDKFQNEISLRRQGIIFNYLVECADCETFSNIHTHLNLSMSSWVRSRSKFLIYIISLQTYILLSPRGWITNNTTSIPYYIQNISIFFLVNASLEPETFNYWNINSNEYSTFYLRQIQTVNWLIRAALSRQVRDCWEIVFDTVLCSKQRLSQVSRCSYFVSWMKRDVRWNWLVQLRIAGVCRSARKEKRCSDTIRLWINFESASLPRLTRPKAARPVQLIARYFHRLKWPRVGHMH